MNATAQILTTAAAEARLAENHGAMDDDLARTVASWWHGGSDHNITALSHGREWGTSGLIAELDDLIRANPDDPWLPLLREWAGTTWPYVFRSSYGHRFIGEDADYESCLTCGAHYELVHDDPTDPMHGRYRTVNGDDPTECTGDTSMLHGEDDPSADACNCVLCTA